MDNIFQTILSYSKVQSTWIYGFSLEEAKWSEVIRLSFIMQRERHAQPRKKDGSTNVGDFCGLVIFRSGTVWELFQILAWEPVGGDQRVREREERRGRGRGWHWHALQERRHVRMWTSGSLPGRTQSMLLGNRLLWGLVEPRMEDDVWLSWRWRETGLGGGGVALGFMRWCLRWRMTDL